MSEIEHLKIRLKELEEKKQLEKIKQKIEQLENEGKEKKNSFGLPGLVIPTPSDIIKKDGQPKPVADVFSEKEKKIGKLVWKWGLIGAVVLVAGYALFRILKGWVF